MIMYPHGNQANIPALKQGNFSSLTRIAPPFLSFARSRSTFIDPNDTAHSYPPLLFYLISPVQIMLPLQPQDLTLDSCALHFSFLPSEESNI